MQSDIPFPDPGIRVGRQGRMYIRLIEEGKDTSVCCLDYLWRTLIYMQGNSRVIPVGRRSRTQVL